MTLRVWWKRWRIRLSAVYLILRPGKYKYFVGIFLDQSNFTKVLEEESSFEVMSTYCAMEEYNYQFIVKSVAEGISDEDMILSRAIFEGKVQEWVDNKNTDNGRAS